MNKAEIISRHAQALKVQVGTSLAIDECEDIMASMMNEAINYTRSCCKLKDKEETAFDLWLKNFKKTEYGYWFDERTVYCYEAMKDIYKTSVKPNL